VENRKRPRFEVWTLMNLLKEYVRKEREALAENDIRFNVLGRWRELDPSVVRELEATVEATRHCRKMSFNIALNYSGRCEIVDACRSIVADWAAGKRADIDEETIGRYLYTSGQPDPDLMVRTSGEMRVSNFLLWQIAYSEIWVTNTLWPDFRRRDLYEAILDYQRRERRYGGVQQPDGADVFASGRLPG
jgi:undecaprenyl diphosphate synthase